MEAMGRFCGLATGRLARSLGEIGISAPEAPARIAELHRELVRRNRVDEGFVYLQVSRGVDPQRDFLPRDDSAATLTMSNSPIAWNTVTRPWYPSGRSGPTAS